MPAKLREKSELSLSIFQLTDTHICYIQATRKHCTAVVTMTCNKLESNTLLLLLFPRSTCLSVLNCPFSITRRELKSDRGAGRRRQRNVRESMRVKVIIWITPGNWITLRGGRLIGQQWAESRLDRRARGAHACRIAGPCRVLFGSSATAVNTAV